MFSTCPAVAGPYITVVFVLGLAFCCPKIERYQLVADKRVVDSEDYGSFPYGFAPAPLNHSSDDDDVFEL